MANYDNSDKKGNQFWRQRTKHGRDRLFNDPVLLQSEIERYFTYIDENPYYKTEQKKGNTIIPKDANLSKEEFKEAVNPIAEIPTIRPYTMQGLCLFLNIHKQYFDDFEKSLIGKEDQLSLDFSILIYNTRQIIDQSQLEGGMLGTFNPMLVSRLLGLKDRQDITSNDQQVNTVITFEGLE